MGRISALLLLVLLLSFAQTALQQQDSVAADDIVIVTTSEGLVASFWAGNPNCNLTFVNASGWWSTLAYASLLEQRTSSTGAPITLQELSLPALEPWASFTLFNSTTEDGVEVINLLFEHSNFSSEQPELTVKIHNQLFLNETLVTPAPWLVADIDNPTPVNINYSIPNGTLKTSFEISGWRWKSNTSDEEEMQNVRFGIKLLASTSDSGLDLSDDYDQTGILQDAFIPILTSKVLRVHFFDWYARDNQSYTAIQQISINAQRIFAPAAAEIILFFPYFNHSIYYDPTINIVAVAYTTSWLWIVIGVALGLLLLGLLVGVVVVIGYRYARDIKNSGVNYDWRAEADKKNDRNINNNNSSNNADYTNNSSGDKAFSTNPLATSRWSMKRDPGNSVGSSSSISSSISTSAVSTLSQYNQQINQSIVVVDPLGTNNERSSLLRSFNQP